MTQWAHGCGHIGAAAAIIERGTIVAKIGHDKYKTWMCSYCTRDGRQEMTLKLNEKI